MGWPRWHGSGSWCWRSRRSWFTGHAVKHEAAAEEREHQRARALRGRERRWDITLAGLEARRAVYISLMEAVTEYENSLDAAVAKIRIPEDLREDAAPIPDKDGEALLERYLTRLSSMVPTVDMQAQSQEVGDALRDVLRHGQQLIATLEEGEVSQCVDQLDEAARLAQRLRYVCRWDLGLDAPNPTEP